MHAPLAATIPTCASTREEFLPQALPANCEPLALRQSVGLDLDSFALKDDPASPSSCFRGRALPAQPVQKTSGTVGWLRKLGDRMMDFYIRRGQSVEEHRIMDEGPGKHPDGVGHLSEHKRGCWRRWRKRVAFGRNGIIVRSGGVDWPAASSLGIDR